MSNTLMVGKTRLRCICGDFARSILQVGAGPSFRDRSFPFCGNEVCERAACAMSRIGIHRLVDVLEAEAGTTYQ